MRAILLGFLVVVVLPGAARAEKKKPRVRSLSFVVVHEPDGKRYPNQVKESYSLEKDGVLRYGAYFGGMPTDMNHNDSAEWPSGEAGKRVFDAAARVADDLVLQSDDEPVPQNGIGVYIVGFSSARGDTTRIAMDRNGKAWKILDPAFAALIAEFEKATGRPRKPSDLPQGR